MLAPELNDPAVIIDRGLRAEASYNSDCCQFSDRYGLFRGFNLSGFQKLPLG
jgi:hypothetical protein